MLTTLFNKISNFLYPAQEKYNEDIFKIQLKQEFANDIADETSKNLYLGKIIHDGGVEVQILGFTEDTITVKILSSPWKAFAKYITLGDTYIFTQVFNSNNKMSVYEISEDQLNYHGSQVLLAWEQGIGWTFDLDM